MQQSELIDRTVAILKQKHTENPLISILELPIFFRILVNAYEPGVSITAVMEDADADVVLHTDDALQEWYKRNGFRTEFLVHKECFHPNWLQYLNCPSTSIAELIYMLEEFKKTI